MTPLLCLEPNLFVKLEYLQVGGSHKSRAARKVIEDAEAAGHLARDGKHAIIEKTGGNFGVGLLANGLPRGYPINLLVRPSFSLYRRRLLSFIGANLIGIDLMEAGLSNADILDQISSDLRKQGFIVYYTDQFNNRSCIDAHVLAAKDELIPQLVELGIIKEQPVALFKACGSSASLNGYATVLKDFFPSSKVILVEPLGCDMRNRVFVSHSFQGASIGVVPPLFEPGLVDQHISVSETEADSAGDYLLRHYGIFAGRSTSLVFAAAQSFAIANSNWVCIFIAYDMGDAYFADNLLSASNGTRTTAP